MSPGSTGKAHRGSTALVLAAGALAIVASAAVAAWVHPLAGVALAVALVAAAFALRHVGLAFVAVIAVITLLPFAALPLGLGFNPTLLDLALGGLLAVWSLRLATRRDELLPLPPLGWGVLLLVALAVTALVAGLEHGTPTKNQLRTFGELVMAATLYFVVTTLVVDRRRLRLAFLALAGFATAAAVVGLALYVLPDGLEMRALSTLRVLDYPSGPGVIRYLNDDPARLQRATGTSIDPNSFGGMLAAVTALVAAQLVARRPLIDRRAAAAMTVALFVALLATVSRGSLVGLAAGLTVIGLARDRRVLVVGIVAGAAFVLTAQFLPWTARYMEHFTAGLAGQDLATKMRFGEYQDAARLITRYPVLGVGFGGVRDVDLYRGVSSLYLIVAETMGLVGLGVFVGLLAAFGARLVLAWRRVADGALRSVILGALAALAAAAVSGVFDHYYFTYPHAFALLWLMLGLGIAAARLGEGAATAEQASQDVNRGAADAAPRIGRRAGPAPSPAPH